MSLKPICVKCQRFYRPLKNGVVFTEGMPVVVMARPGNHYPHEWKPYKMWRGDLWECHGCGHQIISGVGRDPMCEHYMNNWLDVIEDCPPIVQVNDC